MLLELPAFVSSSRLRLSLSRRATFISESFFETLVPTDTYQYIPPPMTPAREIDVETVTLVFAGEDKTVARKSVNAAIDMRSFEFILKA